MSEITKLYENAGVLKECLSPCYINKAWRKTHDCPNCDNREKYPPFTAEKQIELIKWLANKFSFFAIEFNSQQWSSSNGLISGFYTNSLEESIADYINNLWQDLTIEEKQQVKGILE